MNRDRTFYLCPTCFRAGEAPPACHKRPMLVHDGCDQSVERHKPLVDGEGRLQSRAPRWFLEASGWLVSSG